LKFSGFSSFSSGLRLPLWRSRIVLEGKEPWRGP
jgi:hypothetical protein